MNTPWPYISGHQYPETLKLKARTSLYNTLSKYSEIEVINHYPKKKAYHAHCHACVLEWPCTAAQSLERHVASLKHQQSLTDVPVFEQKRKAILENPKFSSFIKVENDTVTCKYCLIELSWRNDQLHSHLNTRRHHEAEALARNRPLSIDPNDPERLKKLKALERQFPDVVSLATEIDLTIHYEFFERYKENDNDEKQTLRLNDLFCKVCRRKFDRTSVHGYRSAIREHIKTKQHEKAAERQKNAQLSGGTLPKKIAPYRKDPMDRIQVTKVTKAKNQKRSKWILNCSLQAIQHTKVVILLPIMYHNHN